MGKASKFKKLRKAAKELPVINTQIAVPRDTVSGTNLIKQGLTKLRNGSTVEAGKFYRQGKVVEKPLNHNRIMKQQYNKYGFKGVATYASTAVINHAKDHDENIKKQVNEKA